MFRTVFNPELFGKKILFLIIIGTMIFTLSCSSDSTEPVEEDLILKFSPAEQTVPSHVEDE